MTKPTISLQELRATIGHRAKSIPTHRFWGLHVHVVKLDTLEAAYLEAKRNNGAPGSDGETFEQIEARGRGSSSGSLSRSCAPARTAPAVSTERDSQGGWQGSRNLDPRDSRPRDPRRTPADHGTDLRGRLLGQFFRSASGTFGARGDREGANGTAPPPTPRRRRRSLALLRHHSARPDVDEGRAADQRRPCSRW